MTVICMLIPEPIVRLYTKDEDIVQAAMAYLSLVLAGAVCLGWSFWKARQVSPAGVEVSK